MENPYLIQKAKQGNDEAINEIFESFNKLIYFLARNYFIIGGDKEDILQEARIGLLKAITYYNFDKKASFKTFAALCIKRHLITVIKSSFTGKNKILNFALSICTEKDDFHYDDYNYSGTVKNYYNPEEIYLEKEKYNALKKYVKMNLSKMENELFEYILLEMTYMEIAKKTGRTPKSVDNAIQRIKKKLKNFFKEYSTV
ncbi:sigma-70 family RNA polymerase sigma factor [Fusobacterium sp.]|uniref:sigma-70 family RNA polymerase sigma factor n=1 Tax=Fusobacterium sp. TaxID=68766 RepID=UPI0028FF7B6E|nr:sigma-70 family RNA polymerase sigma factor [Fusobacterium sp.]MDU1910195.1 sigma-70 family RNA polymerase sigma factor [Fusobacterium sp.]